MTTITKKAIKVLLLAAILAQVTACAGGAQGAPGMMDYSYVPPSNVVAATPNPGIDEF